MCVCVRARAPVRARVCVGSVRMSSGLAVDNRTETNKSMPAAEAMSA